LYRIEVTEGPGSGVRVLNRPAPPPFTESVKYAEANLYSRATELVGDRNPREHEFSIQLRAFDASKNGRSLGMAVLLAFCSALINKSLRGGLVIVGGINLGGSIDPLHNAIDVVELAVEKGASVLLMPVSSRKQLFELSDDLATKVTVVFYNDAREAFIKAIAD
jgi:ATP-dependent Lon protease